MKQETTYVTVERKIGSVLSLGQCPGTTKNNNNNNNNNKNVLTFTELTQNDKTAESTGEPRNSKNTHLAVHFFASLPFPVTFKTGSHHFPQWSPPLCPIYIAKFTKCCEIFLFFSPVLATSGAPAILIST